MTITQSEGANARQNKTLNVDSAEIEKFEVLAQRWWDTGSEFKPLHQINPLRTSFIDQHSPLAGKKVIDIGCGGGILCETLANAGAEVTGIDMGEAPLAVARLHARKESGLNIDYLQITAEEIAEQRPAQYDVVTCMEMLEHVPDPASVIKACATLCKPGGHLYFATINRNPKSYLFAVIGAEYLLRLLPKGTHDYQKFIKPSELHRWLREADLLLQNSTGMTYNPLSDKYKLNPRDLDVNYILHAQKQN